MDFSEAIQNIKDEPKVINVALTDGMPNNCNNEDILIEIKEEPELQIYDGLELETIDLSDSEQTTTTNQSDCKNCPKIVTATGKVQQIHYCYTAEDNNKKLELIARPLHECNLCDKKFTFKSELFVHKRSHRVKPSYKCIKCKRTLFSVNSYKQHVLHAHTGDSKVTIERKMIKMKGVNSEGKPYNYDIMVYL